MNFDAAQGTETVISITPVTQSTRDSGRVAFACRNHPTTGIHGLSVFEPCKLVFLLSWLF